MVSEPYLKTHCVVLKRLPFKDVDAHMILFCHDLGKVMALAKGVGKPTSKLSSVLEVGNLLEVELYDGKAGYTLLSANQLEGFSRRYSSYEALLTSAYICEFVDAATEKAMQQDIIYDLLVKMLSAMVNDNIVEIRLRFVWEYLLRSGYASADTEDFLQLFFFHWNVSVFNFYQQGLVDEVYSFLCQPLEHMRLTSFRLSKKARTLLKQILMRLLREHLMLSIKSEKLLDAATRQFYS